MSRLYKYVNTNDLANYSIDEYESKTRNRIYNFIVYGHSFFRNCFILKIFFKDYVQYIVEKG